MQWLTRNFLNPAFVFCLIWSIQPLGYFVFFQREGIAFAGQTWLVLLLGAATFLLGSFIARHPYFRKFFRNKIEISPGQQVERNIEDLASNAGFTVFEKWFLTLYSVACVSAVYLIYLQIAKSAIPIHSLVEIRTAINIDFLHERKIYNYIRVFQFGIVLCCYFLAKQQYKNRFKIFVFLTVGFISSLLTTSRLFLLLFFILAAIILYSKKIIQLRSLLLTCGGFVILTFLWAYFYGKGTYVTSTFSEFIAWNLKSYLFMGFRNFDLFVQTDYPRLETIVSIPNSFKSILNLCGANMSFRPNYSANSPITVFNTYTFFYPLYHDGGLLFVGFGCFIFGLFHQLIYLWNQIRQTDISVYIFSASLFPLLLTFFEDAYFSSPGVCAMILLPPLLQILFQKIQIRRKSFYANVPEV